MSKVWRRLQRVGKTAYKFEFTIKVHTVTLECVSGWTPNQVSVLWVRRGRRVRTEATSWTTLPGKDTQGVVHWQALEATMTLYMDTNTHKKKFDEKYWTLIVENVANGKHKALATKRINMAQFVDPGLRVLETRQKYQMKPVASKVHLTELQVTFISKFERQGPAIDDDMRSITSEMSELTLGGFEDGYMSEAEGDYNENTQENEQIMRQIAAIGADFQQLSKFSDDPVVETNGVDNHEEMLIVWAREETKMYNNVSICDMRDSWADGAGFCAIIHSYDPNLLNISLLRDPYTNVKLATRAAVQLGISPTIDPLDFHKGKLDKLGILTFVDQLHKRFNDYTPTTDTIVKHKELKKSPEHKRRTASIISRKTDLEGNDEEQRRKDMIARGKLRQSKRRPRKFESENSIDSNIASTTTMSPSPNKTSQSPRNLERSPLNQTTSPASPRPVSTALQTSHSTTLETPPAGELHQKTAPTRDTKLEDQDSVTGSSGIITDSISPSHLAKSMLTSSFENDVYVPGTGLDPDELIREFERQSPLPAQREGSELSGHVESPDPISTVLPSAPLEYELDIPSTEPPSYQQAVALEYGVLSPETLQQDLLEVEDVASVESCDAIMQSLEAEAIQSPSSIKISGISSADDVLGAVELEEKLNDSKNGAAIIMEAILLDEFNKKYNHFIEASEAPRDVSANNEVEDESSSSSTDDNTSSYDVIDSKIAVLDNLLDPNPEPSHPAATEPIADNKFEDEIQAEIAALEEQLNSSFIFKPSAVPPPEPDVLQPTPPVTPPPPRRVPSLRDKIRGLHDAREKLMAACPDPAVISEVKEEKIKPPPVLPKPLDRKISSEKIAILRSSSQESDRASRRSCDSAKLSSSHGEEEKGPTQDTPPDTPQDTPPDSPAMVQQSTGIPVQSPGTVLQSSDILPKSSVTDKARERPNSAASPTPPANQDPLSVSRDSLPVSPSGRMSCKHGAGSSRSPGAGSSRSPKKSGNQFQSLSELVSSFTVKTETETTQEQATDERTGSRCSSPSNVDLTFGSRDMAFGSRDMTFGSRDTSFGSRDNFRGEAGNLAAGSSLHGFAGDRDIGSSMSSMNSEPPPPPPPEPLLMMMGPGEEAEESEESDTELTETEIKQDLQDVRDYMTECHVRITQHNAKLDKRAKVLERELRDVMDAQNHELEQKLLKSWLQLVHERNTLVRKQDELNSLQNEEDLEDKCCQVLKEMRKYQNMRDTEKSDTDLEREEELEQEYKDILKKRETLLRIRDDINTISLEEEAEFQSVLEKPKLLQDQSSCKIA